MYCKKCGSPLTGNGKFCKICGAAVDAHENQGGVQIQSQQSDMMQSQSMSEQSYQQSQSDMMQSQSMNGQSYQQLQQNNGVNNVNGWQNSYNQTPNFQQQRSNSGVIYIVICVCVAIALFAGVFVFYWMKNKGGTSFSEISNKSYKVNFNGFIFEIPDKYIYEEKNGALLLFDEVGNWIIQLEVQKGSFEQLKSQKNQIPSIFQQDGYTCSNVAEKTIGGIEFLTMELSSGGENAVFALTKANAMYFIGVSIFTQDNDFDYKLLEKAAPIVKSAELAPVTNNMSVRSNLDLGGLAELAK